MSFAKEVWETLCKISLAEHAQKKGNLTYVSWTGAWGTLMDEFPESSYEFHEPPIQFGDGTIEVWCTVTVKRDDDEISRTMWLPVMDNRNNAIQGPTARQIGDTRMRCLTKCIAMFGLGHYIYAGEDLPRDREPSQERAEPDVKLQFSASAIKGAIEKAIEASPEQGREVWARAAKDNPDALRYITQNESGWIEEMKAKIQSQEGENAKASSVS